MSRNADNNMAGIDIEEMESSLEEFYEAAGFEDFHARVLDEASNKAVEGLYLNTFNMTGEALRINEDAEKCFEKLSAKIRTDLGMNAPERVESIVDELYPLICSETLINLDIDDVKVFCAGNIKNAGIGISTGGIETVAQNAIKNMIGAGKIHNASAAIVFLSGDTSFEDMSIAMDIFQRELGLDCNILVGLNSDMEADVKKTVIIVQ